MQAHPLVFAPMVHVTTSYKLQDTRQTHYKKQGGN
nr:MAG TPA: hypothetical protein [Caudoviricetes sp.]